MLEDPRFFDSGSLFVEFGAKGATCSNIHFEYLKSKHCEVIWMEKDIRRLPISAESKWKTQAGQMFEQLMHRLEALAEVIFVSFDVDVINSKWMPGVSAPSVIGGLTNE
jgi:arginase family enzyme